MGLWRLNYFNNLKTCTQYDLNKSPIPAKYLRRIYKKQPEIYVYLKPTDI